MAKSVYARYGTPQPLGPQARKHTILAGDTVQKIAAYWAPALGYSSEYWRQVAEANGVEDLDALTIGTVLTIPAFAPED